MRIKEVEELVGITKKNIRYYEKEGLLSPGRNLENSYRDYSDNDVRRLKEIKLLRKLDMPINDIREVLEGRETLPSATGRHSAHLENEIENITQALAMCRLIEEEGASISDIDADGYLEKMDEMEKEGVIFVNIKNRDTAKRYLEPIAAGIVVVLVMTAAAFGILAAARYDPLPTVWLIVAVAIPVLVAVGTIAALASRLKEIRGGEENDLSKY